MTKRLLLTIAAAVVALATPLGQTAFGPFMIPDTTTRAQNFHARTIDASGEYVAWIFQAPKTGTLKSCEFNIETVGNNPDNGLRVSFQNVGASDGLPDGTQDQYVDITGTVSTGWQAPGLMTHDGTGGGTPRGVTSGDIIACRVDFVSFTAGDSVTLRPFVANSQGGYGRTMPYIVFNGAKSGDTDGSLNVAIKYSDDSFATIAGALPLLSSTLLSYWAPSSPDEYALRLQVPVGVRVVGAWGYFDHNGTPELVLYNSGGSILTSLTLDPDVQELSSASTRYYTFPDAIDLDASTTYYLALKAGGDDLVGLYQSTVSSAAIFGAWPGGTEMYQASRTDGGAWTATTTARPILGLIVDAIEAGGPCAFSPFLIGRDRSLPLCGFGD